ncbi:MAG: AraC family transcriptional regulator [Planctomycetes bacterium]|nr:AraC family transcriptional regulator [Planctomycetota bacterium]
MNRAIDHIVRDLERPHRLDEVADVAGFSPFHFHRVFRSLMGETLNQFVRRLRLERALWLRSHEVGASWTNIALRCGFAGSSDFSRAFKQRFGVPPSEFDIDRHRAERRGDLQAAMPDGSGHLLVRLPPGENPDGFEVRIRQLPARTVAYVRVVDPFRPGAVEAAAGRLVEWAEERGRAGNQWLGYMWDDPNVVALSDCRYDVAVECDEFEPRGEVGRFEFPAMCVAEVEIRGAIDLEQRAIDWMFGTWLPQSGYTPADQPCFEAWIGRPFAHGNEHFELCMHLPVSLGPGG